MRLIFNLFLVSVCSAAVFVTHSEASSYEVIRLEKFTEWREGLYVITLKCAVITKGAPWKTVSLAYNQEAYEKQTSPAEVLLGGLIGLDEDFKKIPAVEVSFDEQGIVAAELIGNRGLKARITWHPENPNPQFYYKESLKPAIQVELNCIQ